MSGTATKFLTLSSGIPELVEGAETSAAAGSGIIPALNSSSVLDASIGGTGLATITAHNVIVGEGTSPVGLVAPSATTGVPLVSQGSSSDPAFGTAVVAGGGTGLATLTAHNVMLGEGTSNVAFAAPGATTGVPLVSNNATTDPSFGTASVAGGGTGLTTLTAHDLLVGAGTSNVTLVAPSATSGVALVSAGSSADPAFGQLDLSSSSAVKNDLPVANGGTGAGTLTAHAVLLGEGTSTLGFATIGNAGYVLTDNGSGADPTFQAPASSGNPTAVILAAADIAAGDLVNVYNNAGTANVVPADNTSSTTFANGVALSAISNTTSGTITFGAVKVTGLSGLTPGQLFLDTAGGVTSTAPSSSGDVVQPVGLAITSSVAIFNPGQNYNIA